jgi:hypothetical protein
MNQNILQSISFMKKAFGMISVFAFCCLVSCGDKEGKAFAYNDALVAQQVAVIKKIEKLFDSCKKHEKKEEVDIAYSEALQQLKEGTDIVSKMDAFDGKTDFRDATLKMFMVYRSVLEVEFKEMTGICKLPDEQYTKEKESRCNELEEQIMKKIDVEFRALNAVQHEFMKQNKLDIESDK